MLYLNRMKLVLEALGMNVSVETTEDGQEALNATIEMKRGSSHRVRHRQGRSARKAQRHQQVSV